MYVIDCTSITHCGVFISRSAAVNLKVADPLIGYTVTVTTVKRTYASWSHGLKSKSEQGWEKWFEQSIFLDMWPNRVPRAFMQFLYPRYFLQYTRQCLKSWLNCGLLHDIYRKNVVSPSWCIPYCLFPGCTVTWRDPWLKGSIWFHDFWLAPPEQRYWQNRETANVGQDSSVRRAPAHQSGGRRFKSRPSKFVFVHPNLS